MRKAFLLLFAAILMIKPISLQAKEGFCYEDYKIPEEYISYFEEYGDNNYLVILRYGGRKKEILNYKKTGQISEYASKILWLSEKYERFHNK